MQENTVRIKNGASVIKDNKSYICDVYYVYYYTIYTSTLYFHYGRHRLYSTQPWCMGQTMDSNKKALHLCRDDGCSGRGSRRGRSENKKLLLLLFVQYDIVIPMYRRAVRKETAAAALLFYISVDCNKLFVIIIVTRGSSRDGRTTGGHIA